jgi:hypothetical protein
MGRIHDISSDPQFGRPERSINSCKNKKPRHAMAGLRASSSGESRQFNDGTFPISIMPTGGGGG